MTRAIAIRSPVGANTIGHDNPGIEILSIILLGFRISHTLSKFSLDLPTTSKLPLAKKSERIYTGISQKHSESTIYQRSLNTRL